MQSTYRGHRFLPDIISHAIWLYHRFTLSFRDVEDLLAERGISVSYEAIRCWCIKMVLGAFKKLYIGSCGIMPALRGARTELSTTLKE